jgi:hypothetical protein
MAARYSCGHRRSRPGACRNCIRRVLRPAVYPNNKGLTPRVGLARWPKGIARIANGTLASPTPADRTTWPPSRPWPPDRIAMERAAVTFCPARVCLRSTWPKLKFRADACNSLNLFRCECGKRGRHRNRQGREGRPFRHAGAVVARLCTPRQTNTSLDGAPQGRRNSTGAAVGRGIQQQNRQRRFGVPIDRTADDVLCRDVISRRVARRVAGICGSPESVGVSVSPERVLDIRLLQYGDPLLRGRLLVAPR